VTEEFLDRAQIAASVEQVRSETVPQSVWCCGVGKLEQPAQLAGARDAVAALPAVAQVEVSERDARLTALPKAGATILPALSELAARQGLKLKELHLESGRLDEVFRTITA